jgi:elongation factor G
VILEPIMDVEVTTPNDHVGDVVGDLNRRRGQIQNQESSGSTVMVRAHVPLKEMFGYIGSLRALSSGRAQYSMHFDHYAEVPPVLQAELLAA